MKTNCYFYAPKHILRYTNGIYAASGFEGYKYYTLKVIK